MSTSQGPVLLCFDGSDDATAAIVEAAQMLASRQAIVLSVWDPPADWEHHDPASILTAPLSRFASAAAGVEAIGNEVTQETMERGLALAQEAGFTAEGRVAEGKPWRVICQTANTLGAEPIVVGARGLSRLESALMGSVSSSVVAHARRPVLVVTSRRDR